MKAALDHLAAVVEAAFAAAEAMELDHDLAELINARGTITVAAASRRRGEEDKAWREEETTGGVSSAPIERNEDERPDGSCSYAVQKAKEKLRTLRLRQMRRR